MTTPFPGKVRDLHLIYCLQLPFVNIELHATFFLRECALHFLHIQDGRSDLPPNYQILELVDSLILSKTNVQVYLHYQLAKMQPSTLNGLAERFFHSTDSISPCLWTDSILGVFRHLVCEDSNSEGLDHLMLVVSLPR